MIEIPEQLKADVPSSMWGKILAATPVVMTVLATMLAGLASSEMTRAQYDRSLAAQQQAKAGDQWSFFQAKRLRGEMQENTLDLLRASAEARPFAPARFVAACAQAAGAGAEYAETAKKLVALAESPEGQQALAHLRDATLPGPQKSFSLTPDAAAAVAAIADLRPDREVNELVAALTDVRLEELLKQGREAAAALDAATGPINKTISAMDALLESLGPVGGAAREFTAARLRYSAMRYETEARLNQAIARVYELQVRKSNLSATRHHARSQRFFFGMLAAQAAVIIATFAMAARQRNLLWSLAALVGLIAVGLAIYVYLWV